MFENENKRWVVGVSGGIDSMSLLDMLYKAHVDIIICHVNYHKRDSSNYDQSVVERYAKERNIPCFVREVKEEATNNFQAWARIYRYQFYKEIIDEYNCVGVMLAHHADDYLETALLRERQGRNVSYYGIKESGNVLGVYVYRPLLKCFKEDLEKYIVDNGIEYGQDESNFDTHYERNKIRNITLVNLSKAEKQRMIDEYQVRNEELKNQQQNVMKTMEAICLENGLIIDELMKLDNAINRDVLRYYLQNIDDYFYRVSDKFLNDLLEFVASNKARRKSIGDFLLLKEFGLLRCIVKQDYTYSYQLDEIKEMETPHFKIVFSGDLRDGLTLTKSDFPIIIRNVMDGDRIHFSFGHRNIKHYLVEKKVPYEERECWPIIENCNGEIIFVCNLGSNLTHFTNKPSVFVVK